MADRVSIAIMQERAFERLHGAMARIGSALGVEFDGLPVHGRDRDLLQAERWTVMAANAERAADALTQKLSASAGEREQFQAAVEALTVAELRDMGEKMGLDLPPSTKKAQLVDAIMSASFPPAPEGE